MRVTIETFAAIFNFASAIANARNEVTPEKAQPLTDFFSGIKGFDDDAMRTVIDCANNNPNLTAERAVELVSALDYDAKRKVVDLLAAIVRAGDQIIPEEKAMFDGLVDLCNLPMPTIPFEEDPDDALDEPTFLIARTNGLVQPYLTNTEDYSELDSELAAQIKAQRTEVVRYTAPLNALSKQIGLSGCHLVFLVDRNGYAKEDIGDNMTGTILYGSGQPILGDIVFALETDSGYNIQGVKSMKLLTKIYNTVNDAVGELLRLE